MDIGALTPADRHVEGVVEMMLDATQKYRGAADGGTPVRLARRPVPDRAQRHAARSRSVPGATTNPDRCRSSRDRSARSASTTKRRSRRGSRRRWARFLTGSTVTASIDPVLKAGLAHLWFVTIHPFDDGNGRIARAIADMALARSEQSSQRFYSMSGTNPPGAERLLRHAGSNADRPTLDITSWLQWFLGCLDRAFGGRGKSFLPTCSGKRVSGRSTQALP